MPRRPSLLGRGLPERLRSTSLALVGLVGAVGLTTISFTLQPGPPLVSSGPIPDPPHQSQASRQPAVATAKSAAQPAAPTRSPATEEDSTSRPAPPHGNASIPVEVPTGGPEPAGDPVLVTSSKPRGDGGAESVRPAPKNPIAPSAAPPASPPAPAPAAPAPQAPTATTSTEPPPPPAPEPPPREASGQPGNGHAYGRGSGKGHGSTGTPPGQAVD